MPPDSSRSTTRATLALILGVLCIGFAPIFVKLASAPGWVVGAYRLSIAGALLAIPIGIKWRRGRARLPRHALWIALMAGVAFAVDMTLWNTSLTLTSASSATFLGTISPVWVGLATWLLLGEQLRPVYWLGLGVALGGAGLLVGLDGFGGSAASTGNLLALAASFAYAAYQLIASRGRQHADTLTFTGVFTVTGALLLIAFSLAVGSPLTGLPPRSLLAILALAVVSHIGGWLLINYAYGVLPGALVAVMLLGQPVIATLIAAPILGEVPTPWHLLGGGITLLGIIIVHRSMQTGT